jgi:uncharacterized protein YndB with AHSA1/START domain
MSDVQPFSISRVLDAPRPIVWQVHTDPVHIQRWMGPAGMKVIKSDLDLRVGGRYHYGLEGPDGSRMWGRQIFREITPVERLVYIQSFSDEQGGITRHPMADTWPLEMLSTVTFEALDDGRTKVTVSWLPYNSDEAGKATFDAARPGMEQGFGGMLAKLEEHIKEQETQILSSRHLRAPRELVWAALTDPAKVNVWWGPDGFKNVDVEQDVRVGGVWRFKMVGPDGTVYPNRVIYLELTPPSRMVFDHGDDESIHFQSTITLDEEAGGTRISLGARFPSREARDAVLKFGAIEGGRQTLAKLDAFLGSSAA